MDKEKYLKENKGLIAKFASKYFIQTSKFDFDDLVAIGNKAAIHALNMFDESKGKINTYVCQAVKRDIRDFVSKNKHDLYVSSYGQRGAWEEIKNGNKDPLANTIALRINWDSDPTKGDMEETGYVSIPSGEPPADEALMKQEQLDILMDELSTLPARDQDVIKSRYFDGQTLIQIANRLNVTKQRINQIESRAMNSLYIKCKARGIDESLI